jgi:hypothetical protein
MRIKRVLRILLAALVGLFLLLTLTAVAIDVSPLGASKPARSLYAGPYVQVGQTLVAYRDTGHSWLAHLYVYPWYDATYRLLSGWDWLVGQVLRNAWGRRRRSSPTRLSPRSSGRCGSSPRPPDCERCSATARPESPATTWPR